MKETINIVCPVVHMAIEMRIGDVCEGLQNSKARDEVFHLAHDWLIDECNYTPEVNEAVALEVAERIFPACDDEPIARDEGWVEFRGAGFFHDMSGDLCSAPIISKTDQPDWDMETKVIDFDEPISDELVDTILDLIA